MYLQIPRTEPVRKLERSQRQGQYAEERVRYQIEHRGRKVPRDGRSGIENLRILHVNHECSEQPEDYKKNQLGL